MARIRSLHPGMTTDEAYMAMSAYAKAAWPPLWTDCDDQGVFEWKPLVLKAKLLPADTVSFDALLAEWVSLGVIVKFECGGRGYGAVRNFQRFQRPKKPNQVHPLPSELRTFVGLKEISSEPVPHLNTEPVTHQSVTGGRKPALMKEGGSIYPSERHNSEVVDLETGEIGEDDETQPTIAVRGSRR